MRTLELHQDYDFSLIEIYADANNFELISVTENNHSCIGEAFLVLKHKKKDITLSFVLTSASLSTYYYKLIYTNL